MKMKIKKPEKVNNSCHWDILFLLDDRLRRDRHSPALRLKWSVASLQRLVR